MSNKFEILIVDDMKDNLLALNALLEREDVKISQALSGNVALELLMKHDFCLALIDVNMPHMSGFELAEFMRGSKKTKNVPIIFVTATAKDQSFSFKGYESGAVDFLLKPLDPHAVKSKVNVFIELFQQKNELCRQLTTITELMADLNASKDEAEKANTSKTQFLANMSHEIRTPIGAILGFIDLLKNPAILQKDKDSYMVVVEKNSQQLLSLIDDILDLSKVEAGKMTVENIEFSLAEMLSDIQASMNLKAESKGIQFIFFIETTAPHLICTDPVRLRQVLGNVLGNAIKFTERGSVELRVFYSDPMLKFVVTDTGLGITKEQGDCLFEPFSQADSSTTRKYGGTGLGLILSRRLCQAMGGRLDLVNSRANVGSTFSIEVNSPLLQNAIMCDEKELMGFGEPQPVARNNKKMLIGLKVLLVEDSQDNQMLITTYLGMEGAVVKVASDGSEGINCALAEEFDVVLMDIQMPVLDGHEATKKLRSLNYEKPIIALTAHAMKEEKAKCIASGFTDFLAKPLQRDLLTAVLTRYIKKPTSKQSSNAKKGS